MTLEIVIPESEKPATTKDCVFTLLTDGESRTLTQLHRGIKKRYRHHVTFQAVIKAVHSLLDRNVLVKNGKTYSLNEEWLFHTRNFFDRIYAMHCNEKRPFRKVDVGKDVVVYTLHNLLELDRLWNDLLLNWAKSAGKDRRNCWRGRHAWWLMPRLQEEDSLHDFMIAQRIKTYNLWTKETLLDSVAVQYYKKKKEHTKIDATIRIERDEHIAAFGNTIVKFEIPAEISKGLEHIYRKTKKLEYLDVKQAIDLFKKGAEIEFTVIKDAFLADNVKSEIISHF